MAKPSGFSSGFGPGFGVGRYYYGLHQYQWITEGELSYWGLPSSVVGAVDLRTLGQMSQVGGTPQGFAFVAAMQPIDVLVTRSLHFADENVTGAMQDALESEIGYRPEGDKVADLLYDLLTGGADPQGDAGPLPLMPGVDGQFKLFVGGHSLVKRERFRPNSTAGRKCLDLLRRQYSVVRQESLDGNCRNRLGEVDERCHLKVLDYWTAKYKLPYRVFQGGLPDEKPVAHETTITESFNKADGALGPDLSWTNGHGGSGSPIFTVVSNAASHSVAAFGMDRADSDLSSDDHYAQATITSLPSTNQSVGTACRKDSSATVTYYMATLTGGTDQWRTHKWVAGSLTAIGSNTGVTAVANDVIKLESDGSTITRYRNGASQNAATDTSNTGQLRCGLSSIHGTGGGVVDGFEAADLAAPPAEGTQQSLMLLGTGA